MFERYLFVHKNKQKNFDNSFLIMFLDAGGGMQLSQGGKIDLKDFLLSKNHILIFYDEKCPSKLI